MFSSISEEIEIKHKVFACDTAKVKTKSIFLLLSLLDCFSDYAIVKL